MGASQLAEACRIYCSPIPAWIRNSCRRFDRVTPVFFRGEDSDQSGTFAGIRKTRPRSITIFAPEEDRSNTVETSARISYPRWYWRTVYPNKRISCTWTLCKKTYSTGYSQAVTHPSTNPAQCCLTSVIRREPVHSERYGCRTLTPTHRDIMYRGNEKVAQVLRPCESW